eukprot:156816-Amphidinium_carterae.1
MSVMGDGNWPVRTTVLRASASGRITKELWLPIERRVFKIEHRICLHTDSARVYEVPNLDASHTSIVHQLKKINGVWVAKSTRIDIGGGKPFPVMLWQLCA